MLATPTKNDDKPIVAIRFEERQRTWLRREAERLDRPIGWIIRRLIEEAIKDEETSRRVLETPRPS